MNAFAGARHLYLHFPLCAARCPYCAFNVTTSAREWRAVWVDRVLRGVEHHAPAPQSPAWDTVYLGGGTPSLLDVAAEGSPLLKALSIAPGAEVTLEVNPSSAGQAALRAWRDAGVTRLSVGVQSLDEATLRRLGRDHSVADALRTLEDAAAVFGPDAVSADLMVWLQGAEPLRYELRALASLASHLSVYELTLEPATPFYKAHAKGELPFADADARAASYELVAATMQLELGWERYEVSSFAKRRDTESRHNWAYWSGRAFLGLGPGAHSRLRAVDGTLWERVETAGPREWAKLPAHATAARMRALTPTEERHELIMTALRTRKGLDAAQRAHVAPCLDAERVERFVVDGLLQLTTDGALVATPRGLALLDGLVERMVTDYAT